MSAAEVITEPLLERSGERCGLRGWRCTNCGEIFFPEVQGCTRCCGHGFEPYALGDRGVLWSWTVQAFLPKTPYDSGEDERSFRPYGVGYVEMPCGLKVEGRLVANDFAALKIGMPMRLTLEAYRRRPGAEPVYTYAFCPAAESP